MAEQLVAAMAGDWEPDLFHDEFREKLMALVEQKSRDGGLRTVAPLPGEDVQTTAEVIDLTELLRRSLKGNGKAAAPAAAPAARKPAAKREEAAANDEAVPLKKAAARKAPATARASAKPATRRKSG
jgi:DNA end-binding protein Ku